MRRCASLVMIMCATACVERDLALNACAPFQAGGVTFATVCRWHDRGPYEGGIAQAVTLAGHWNFQIAPWEPAIPVLANEDRPSGVDADGQYSTTGFTRLYLHEGRWWEAGRIEPLMFHEMWHAVLDRKNGDVDVCHRHPSWQVVPGGDEPTC